MKGKYIKTGPIADSVPFDNDNDCNLSADTVQEAIEEVCAKIDAETIDKLYMVEGCFITCGKFIPENICALVDDELCFIVAGDC